MTHAALAAMANHDYLNLETFKKNGDGVKTPVWFAEQGGGLVVFTDGTSFKVKRLKRDPRARFAACNVNGKKLHTSWFDGTVTFLAPGPEQDAAYVALRAKYGWQIRFLDVVSKLGGRYGRRAVFRIDPT